LFIQDFLHFLKNVDYIKMIELTRKQKIGFGFGAAGVLLVTAIVVIYFVFFNKKDTPKPTPKPTSKPTPTSMLTNTLTPTPTNTNSLSKSDKIKELEQIYKDAQTNQEAAQKNYDAAQKNYDDADAKQKAINPPLIGALADVSREFLKALNNSVEDAKSKLMDANSALIRARQNLGYALK
jgi:hypothetical protein